MSTPLKQELTREQLIDYVKRAKAKIKILEEKLEASKAELAAASSAGSENDVTSLREELVRKNAENAELSQKLSSMEDSFADQKQAMQAKDVEMEESRNEMDALIEKYEAKLTALEAKHATEMTTSIDHSAFDAQLNDLQSKLEKAQAEIAAKTEAANSFQSQMVLLEEKKATLEKECTISRVAIGQLKNGNRDLEQEVDALKTSLASVNANAPANAKEVEGTAADAASVAHTESSSSVASKKNKKKNKKKKGGSRSNSVSSIGNEDEAEIVLDSAKNEDETGADSPRECGTPVGLADSLVELQAEVTKLNGELQAKQKVENELRDKLSNLGYVQMQAASLQDALQKQKSHADLLEQEFNEKCKAEDELAEKLAMKCHEEASIIAKLASVEAALGAELSSEKDANGILQKSFEEASTELVDSQNLITSLRSELKR
jgi:chromosome segregation ATPase